MVFGFTNINDAAQLGRIPSQGDAGGGRVRYEGDVNARLYSSVQCLVDEKASSTQRWAMKTGKLTREIDQNQTTRAAKGGESNRRLEQTTHQSKILMWEGRIQSGKLTEDSAEDVRQNRPHGQTENSRTSKHAN